MDKIRADLLHRQDIQKFIQECELDFQEKVLDIAKKIRQEEIDFVLVSGPSSAGKTTFVRLLSRQLKDLGRTSIRISLDNYFLDRSALTEDIDFESISAIDTVSFFADMNAIIRNEMVELPIYDFTTGRKKDRGVIVDGAKCDVVIIEGLHALNDVLLETQKSFHVLTVFLNPTPGIVLQDGQELKGTDLRFLRRLVRDYKFRNSSALNTFYLWKNVRCGEKKYVFPESVNAQIVVDTTHLYEVGVLKPHAKEHLLEIPQDSEYAPKAQELLAILDQFEEIDNALVPKDSLLREFIG
jgi:uridine kinase